MSHSVMRKVLKWTLLVTPWLLALLLAVGWGLAEWTPGYLEKLVPQTAAEMGLPLEEFHIRDAGLFSADIGPVRLGSEADGLTLNNVHAAYTPASLKQGRVNAIILDGIRLSCMYDGTTFRVPVLDLLKGEESGTSSEALPELPFDSLEIRDSILVCDMQGKQISVPFSATVSPGDPVKFTAILLPRDQRITVSGALGPTMNDLSVDLASENFRLGALADFLPLPLNGVADLRVTATVDLTRPTDAVADIETTLRDMDLSALGVGLAEGETVSAKVHVEDMTAGFSLTPVQVASPIAATVTVPEGKAAADFLTLAFSLNAMGVELPGSLEARKNGEAWDVAFSAANPNAITVETGGRPIRLAGLDVRLKGNATPESADVVVSGSTKGAALPGTGLQTGSTVFSLPLAWPAPKRHTPGTLRVSGIRHEKRNLGSVTAQIRQEDMRLAIGGSFDSELLPKLRVPFSGSASMVENDAAFSFDMGRYTLPDNFNPAKLTPAMKGMQLSGTIALEGGVNIREGNIDSRLGLFFTNGTLTLTESGTKLTGIRLFFESPDLVNFRSSPAQMLAFDTLTAGAIEVKKGVAAFQLEPRGVVLVENIGFDWAGGHVSSRAFRIVPGHDEYDVNLFCSELRLSDILGQLGLAEAQGEAALSGELPVTWRNGKISFNNGFLHSTPGEGGVIRVEAMQDLVDAIPEGTPQRGQLELAQAAIKDFEYKWVRIKADTMGEDLLVRLSLDGKPASTLPFVYRREFGGFAKVTGEYKGSNFQGMRLDVNFNLPLDRILLYKDVIKMIE